MISDELLMAYADGELDAVTMRRIERAIAADRGLAAKLDAHRALRGVLGAAFAGIADEPVPERLRAAVQPVVVPLRPRRPVAWRGWTAAIAASLILGLGIGAQLGGRGAIVERGGVLLAEGALEHALDRQPAGAVGDTHMLVSFEDRAGRLCRVFDVADTAGIACREPGRWIVIRTHSATAPGVAAAYRRAGSPDVALLAEAQDMMEGDPLDAAAEALARARQWQSARR